MEQKSDQSPEAPVARNHSWVTDAMQALWLVTLRVNDRRSELELEVACKHIAYPRLAGPCHACGPNLNHNRQRPIHC